MPQLFRRIPGMRQLHGEPRDRLGIIDSVASLLGGELALHGFGAGWLFDVIYDYDADLVRVDVLQVGTSGPRPIPEPGTLALTLTALARGCATRWRWTRRTVHT